MKAILKKITSTHNNLRTDAVEGTFLMVPTVECQFSFFAEPLDKTKDFRQISTTPVKTVEAIAGGWRFTTENSTYELEIVS